MPTHFAPVVRLGAGLFASLVAAASHGANCDQTSVGLVPLPLLGPSLYLDQFQGGLYPGGTNQIPVPHRFVGVNRGWAVTPRLPTGQPSPLGKYVLLSIGMSNTSQEFCGPASPPCAPWSFTAMAEGSAQVEQSELVIVNGAAPGQSAGTWDSPSDPNYDRVRDLILAPQGLSEAQVQVAWVKVANPAPTSSLPAPEADASALLAQLGDIVRSIRARYPNIRQVFLSSRIYAGYASTPLNPEPFAYESAFAVKWLIEAQIEQMAGQGADPIAGDLSYQDVAPWLAWGPYLWADGETPSPLDLTYSCSDFLADGTHPSPSGAQKVADQLLDFMPTAAATMPWFRADGGPNPADLTGDQDVDGSDLGVLLAHWGACDACSADYNGDGVVSGFDLGYLLARWD
jgi:hypothetical protein